MNARSSRSLASALLALTLACPALRAQGAHEIIRGRVLSDSGRAVAGADVIATRAPDRLQAAAKTDAGGAFSLDFTNGTGDYLVQIGAPGFTPFVRRVMRSGSDTVIVLDVKLATKVQALAPAVTRAATPRPDRAPPGGVDVGAAEALPGPYRRVPPDQAGDLAAIAGMIPGVLSTPGGISVLGLNPSQNSTTLNGMAFGGGAIPRDIASRVRVSSATYDPSNGWFSGARTNVQMLPANELFLRANSHFTFDAPPMQANDPVSSRLGQRFTNFNASAGGLGVMLDDRFSYNYGLQGYRKTADLASIANADPLLLQHTGVSSDSVARFLNLMRTAGVPLGSALGATTDNVVFLGRFDHAPYNWKNLTPARTTWGLTGYASLTRNDAQGVVPQATPAHGGQSSQATGAVQVQYSTYFGSDWLADLRSGVTYAHSTATPYLSLPDGRVLVSSAFPDGTAGVTSLQFGGNSGFQSDSRTLTWESMGELQFYPAGYARHRLKVAGDLRFDAATSDQLGNRNGSYSYNSLDDIANGTPASFSRTLNAPTRKGAAWNAFASIGDLWRVTPSVQLLYGARVEGNMFASLPDENPAVASTFGHSTGAAPNSMSILPRLGATWNVPASALLKGGSIRFGFGEFRNLLDPALLAGPYVQTGLPGGLSRISCIGSAVPAPNWSAWSANPSSVPSSCAGGQGTPLVDAAPSVQMFDRGYQPSTSWRGNVSWSSGLWGRTSYTLEGVFSYNVSQPGSRDLNFSGVQRGVLADEGRPLFVTPSSIVAASGAVSPVESRRSGAFGRVNMGVSDLIGNSSQFQVFFRPDLVSSWLNSRLRDPMIAYVYSDSRQQVRGFNGGTFGDPSERFWSRGDLNARHQFTAQTVFWPFGGGVGPGIFFYAHLRSGLPFTPMVSGDVNGDGLANDRAFIFNPAKVADTRLASGLRALGSSSDGRTRDCINGQAGRAAGRNSCEGPWNAALNMNVVMRGEDLFGERFSRWDFALNFTNPLGGLDQLLHGSNNLHGWGTAATPDPVLYSVRGYDPAANRFHYEVNPRFGSTAPSANTIRAPFRVTLDVGIDIAPGFPAQQVGRWLTPGRNGHAGPKLSRDDLVARLRRTVPDPYAPLIAQSDSLLLTPDQVAKVGKLNVTWKAQTDSIYSALATWMAAQPDNYPEAQVIQRSDDAQKAALELTRLQVREELPKILAPAQLAIIPGTTRYFYNALRPVTERFFIP